MVQVAKVATRMVTCVMSGVSRMQHNGDRAVTSGFKKWRVISLCQDSLKQCNHCTHCLLECPSTVFEIKLKFSCCILIFFGFGRENVKKYMAADGNVATVFLRNINNTFRFAAASYK